MSYCMRCGKPTENENFICDECAQKEIAQESAGANSPNQPSSQPSNQPNQPPNQQPNNYGCQGAAWAAPYAQGAGPYAAAPTDRSKLPFNKCGLIGMIFSLIGLLCLIGIFVLAVSFVMSNTEILENPYYQPSGSELMAVGAGVLLLMFGSFAFSVTGISLSGVGLARYRRFRAVGFAVAGLAIGIVALFITFALTTSVFNV